MHPTYPTPFELGNQNQTTTWADCIAFYRQLAADFPAVLRFFEIGVSDDGIAMHAGIVSADGVFERDALRAAQRPIFFNNNGIHPGEPEGIDACMALVRDLCCEPARLAALGRTAYLFIPVYNVDGCATRNTTSRVNQLGPESFGFRGNGRHLDLNRDFVKCDSLAAQAFNRFYSHWSPDVMVDTHTSNGADYRYTQTLIHTQSDKLGAGLGGFLRETFLPDIYAGMAASGWPTSPYVHPLHDTPDDGIAHMLDVPRFSTGYAALHHTIGFMPETHMLKPFADRYAATLALLVTVLALTSRHAAQIIALREAAQNPPTAPSHWPVHWQLDMQRPTPVRFKGFEAVRSPSKIGNYTRLAYDRSRPWEKDIQCFDRCNADIVITAPRAYLIPQAWREVIERLQWNGVLLERLAASRRFEARVYRIESVTSRPGPYEGHLFHDQVQLSTQLESCQAAAGDYLLRLDQPNARYAVETLEPQAHDSFFRWGFFNSVLEQKEHFSDYVFEDTALQMLAEEPALRTAFDDWKTAHPELLADQLAVLGFIYAHGQRFAEPAWRRYPVAGLLEV